MAVLRAIVGIGRVDDAAGGEGFAATGVTAAEGEAHATRLPIPTIMVIISLIMLSKTTQTPPRFPKRKTDAAGQAQQPVCQERGFRPEARPSEDCRRRPI